MAGTTFYHFQEVLYNSLFSTPVLAKFIQKVVITAQFFYDSKDVTNFSSSCILALSVINKVWGVLKKHLRYNQLLKKAIIRLLLLVQRLDITELKDREEVRLNAKDLAKAFDLTDDIRIQNSGEVRFHFSNAFFNMKCPSESINFCIFGEDWCPFQHIGESFDTIQKRMFRPPNTKVPNETTEPAKSATFVCDLREQRDRRFIEQCIDQGTEIPIGRRQHYANLIKKTMEERHFPPQESGVALMKENLSFKPPLDEMVQGIRVLTTESQGIRIIAREYQDVASLEGERQDIVNIEQEDQDIRIIKREGRKIKIFESQDFQSEAAHKHHQSQSTDDFISKSPTTKNYRLRTNTEQLIGMPAEPSKFYRNIGPNNRSPIAQMTDFKETMTVVDLETMYSSRPSNMQQSEITIPDSFFDLFEDTKPHARSTLEGKIAPGLLVNFQLDEIPKLPATPFPAITPAMKSPSLTGRSVSIYTPSILELSDDEMHNLGPALKPTTSSSPIERTIPVNAFLSANSGMPTPSTIQPRSNTFSEPTIKTKRTSDSAIPLVDLPCGHFARHLTYAEYNNKINYKCIATVMKRHPVCFHAVSVKCHFNVDTPGFPCEVCAMKGVTAPMPMSRKW
ncbi:hypothetical protein TWF694_006675 [Orbilia ellipsospora]|uniref:Uncharacterized protein n=1 Tax=Orbilia ellipsospora TaxID=2528407 RepID=A0AAV9XL87_9PEZI